MTFLDLSAARKAGLTGALALSAMMLAAPAQAGYEFATRADNCTVKIDTPGDGSDLRLPMGTVDVEFWGFGLDFASPVTVSPVQGTGTTEVVTIVARHNGAENANRLLNPTTTCGWGVIGSIVVRLTSGPETATSGFRKRLNIGTAADSRVPLSIRRIPRQDTLLWAAAPNSNNCLGTMQSLLNNKLLKIQLPPGHLADQTNCTLSLSLLHQAHEDFQVDASASFNVHFNNLPPFATPNTASLVTEYRQISGAMIDLDVYAIRALTETWVSDISLAGPNNLNSPSVRLEITPSLGLGLVSLTASPTTVTRGDATDVRAQIFPAAAVAGQQLDFTADVAACFDLAAHEDSPRFANANIRTFTITNGLDFGIIQLRSRLTANCSAAGAGIAHRIKMWLPGTDPDSCPRETCLTAGVNVRR